jgi:hypothetical protein
MTDVRIESPSSEQAATPRRRRGTRAAGAAAATTTRRRRLHGADLIESLRESVEQLIKENRSLKRQLAKASGGGGPATPGTERTLRSIQRKVLRAVSSDGAPRRRVRAASAATNGRRRRRTTKSAAGAGE